MLIMEYLYLGAKEILVYCKLPVRIGNVRTEENTPTNFTREFAS